MGISSIDSCACSTKFERSTQNVGASAQNVLVGNLPKRGNSPSPCNGLFALEEVSFSTGFLRDLAPGDYPAEHLDGLTSPA
jgi:hypothetical protein